MRAKVFPVNGDKRKSKPNPCQASHASKLGSSHGKNIKKRGREESNSSATAAEAEEADVVPDEKEKKKNVQSGL